MAQCTDCGKQVSYMAAHTLYNETFCQTCYRARVSEAEGDPQEGQVPPDLAATSASRQAIALCHSLKRYGKALLVVAWLLILGGPLLIVVAALDNLPLESSVVAAITSMVWGLIMAVFAQLARVAGSVGETVQANLSESES